MKTMIQQLVKRALIAGAVVVSAGAASAQCNTVTTITSQNGATINYTNQSSTSGNFVGVWVDISFGDGVGTNPGMNSSGSHTYTTNGTFVVYTQFTSYDPADTSNQCIVEDYDTVVVTGLAQSCGLQANAGSYDNSNNLANSAYIFGYTQGTHTGSHMIIEGQFYWNTDSILYTFPSPGDYPVCYYAEDTTGGNFCYDSICITVHVSVGNPQPQCSSYFYLYQDSVNVGSYFAVSYASTANPSTTSYYWDFGDGSSSTQQYPFHQYASPGVYTVCLTVYDWTDSCSATYCDSTAGMKISAAAQMSSITVVASATGIKDHKEQISKTAVYPNPMTNASSIAFESASSMTGKIQLVNLLGAVVYSENVNINKGANVLSLNTASLAPGMYYVNVIANNQLLGTVKAVK